MRNKTNIRKLVRQGLSEYIGVVDSILTHCDESIGVLIWIYSEAGLLELNWELLIKISDLDWLLNFPHGAGEFKQHHTSQGLIIHQLEVH